MRFPLILTALVALLCATPGQAQHTWVHNPATGHWYALTSAPQHWDVAQAEALSVGGYLTTLNDAAENAWVYANFGANEVNGHGPWMGLWQNFASPGFVEPGGGWEWMNGNVLGYTNWFGPEPNNANGGEHHAHFHGSAAGGSQWNDAPLDLFGGLWAVIETDNDPGLELQVSNLFVGSAPTFQVSGANPGDTVGVAYSLAGAGPTSVTTPCGPFIMELSLPMALIGMATADPLGVATLSGPTLPGGALGLTIWFDGLNTTTCVSSPGVVLTVL